MNKKKTTVIKSDKLRQAAELLLKKKKGLKAPSYESDNLKLIHKLEVHQIELKMQNEELVKAKEKAELAEADLIETAKELAIIKESADELNKFTQDIIDTVPEPLLAIDKDLRVIKASRSFYKVFKVTAKETIGQLIYELGNHQWDIPKLRELLEEIIPEKNSFDDYEVEHTFSNIGKRVMRLNARRVKRAFGKEKVILLAFEDITERKGKEDTLKETHRETSEFLNNLLNHMHAPIIVWDSSMIIRRFNSEFEQLSGYDSAEVIDKNIDFLFPKEKIAETLDLLKNHLADEQEIIEVDILTKDKNIRTVLWNSSHVLDEDGKEIVATISQDITSRKLAEEKLMDERNIATQYFETAGIMMVVLDKAGKVARINKKGCELLQYSEPEITGKEWVTFLPENNVQAIRTTFKQLMEEEIEDLGFYENTVVNQKGEERLIEWNNVILRDNAGKPVGTLSSGDDITQRKMREKISLAQRDLGILLNTISNSLECYRLALKTMSEISRLDCGMIYLFDEDDNSLDAVYSEGFSDKFVEAASHYDAGSPNVMWLKAGDPVYLQHKAFPANLSEYIKEENIKSMAIIPMYYEDEVFGSINLASKKEVDISNDLKSEIESIVSLIANTIVRIQFEDEIRNLNASLEIKVKERTEQLNQATKEADSANNSKSEFLSRMSHELRTPLNGILGFAQLLDRKETNPESTKRIKQILHSGKHLLNLINEVLDIARIESGKLTLSLESVELTGIINETIDIVSQLAKKRDVKLVLEDTAANKLFVKSDQQKLKQVLINLVNNAIKYNRDGGEVKVMITPMGDHIRISVRDTGIGIAQEELHKLFKPFHRISSEISEVEGTGLGLALSKQLVSAMNGNIGVESELGVGSTFWIELPQTRSPLKTGGQTHDRSKTASRDYASSGTILYIEDNISSMQLVEDILRTERPNVTLITDMYGKNTVKMAKEYKPVFILLDLDLPDIHGSEVLTLLQKEPATKSIPVVILSADAMQKSINQLLKAGAKNYLSKPLDIEIFLEVIDELLDKGGKKIGSLKP